MLKQELADAQARIAELNEAAKTSKETIAEQKQKISELEGKVVELENSAKTHASEIEAKDKAHATLTEKVTALEGEKTNLTAQLTLANADVATLKANAKSSTDRATEIAARNGANLPAKKPEAGNKEVETAATGTPRERLAQLWEPKSADADVAMPALTNA